MFVYSTVDDITADACPLSSQKSFPSPMANARVKYIYPLTSRQVPLYIKPAGNASADMYLAVYRCGNTTDTIHTGKNVSMIITGSWMSGLSALSTGRDFESVPDIVHDDRVLIVRDTPCEVSQSLETMSV